MWLRAALCFFLAMTIAAGVALRFTNLRGVIVWYDESFTLLNMSGWEYHAALKEMRLMSSKGPVLWKPLNAKYQKPADNLVEATKAHQVDQPEHTPGFYDSLLVWSKLWGNSRIATLRSWSALLGALTIPAFAWFAWEFFHSRQVSLLASGLIALSPFLYCYSQELREYSMFALVFSLSCALFLRAMKRERILDWALFWLISAFSLYTSFLTLLVLLAQGLFALLTAFLDRKTKETRFKSFFMWIPAIVGAIAVNIGSLMALFNRLTETALNTNWMSHSVPFSLLVKSWLFVPLSNWIYNPQFTFFFKDSRYASFEPMLYLLLILELLCVYLLMRRAPRQFAFLLCIFGAFAVAIWGQDLVKGGLRATIPRYVFPVPIIAVLPVAFAVDQLLESKKRLLQAGGALMLALFLCCQIDSLRTVTACRERGMFWYESGPVAKILNEHPEELVIISSEDELFPQVLALGHLVRDEQKFAWIGRPIPDWVYQVPSAYLIHATGAAKKKFKKAGFSVETVDEKYMVSRLVNRKFSQ